MLPHPDRFWDKVLKTDTCWEWTASMSPKGYGQYRLDGHILQAHRVAYALLIGDIPDGQQARSFM